MSLIVPRSVTVVDDGRSRSAPLTEFRSERAYVLLGDPGAGKTEAFRMEQPCRSGQQTRPARRFISRSLDRHPEWKAETLFIDGLDEVRAGRPDARRPMDLILERLERLGSPNLRVSCRAADWLGRNDLQEIVSTAGYGDVRILHLEPLRHEDILRILATSASRIRAASWAKPVSAAWRGCSATRTRSDCWSRPWQPTNGPATAAPRSRMRVALWLASATISTAPFSAPRPSSRSTGSWLRPGISRRSCSCPTRGTSPSTRRMTPRASASKTSPTAISPRCCEL